MVGLGNPGPRYARTRHNVGFRIAERFAERHGIALEEVRFAGLFGEGRAFGDDVAVLEPGTFMNRSGASVAAAVEALGLDPATELVVAYDDLDLPFGRLRVRAQGGGGGHNGLADILAALGTRVLPRLRFGIGRPGDDPPDAVAWVLGEFGEAESAALGARLDAAVHAIDCIFREGITPAMNQTNAAPAADEGPAPS